MVLKNKIAMHIALCLSTETHSDIGSLSPSTSAQQMGPLTFVGGVQMRASVFDDVGVARFVSADVFVLGVGVVKRRGFRRPK